jgi:hypothetical protein
LRSAVERQLEIIGKALAQLARNDTATAQKVPDLRRSSVAGFADAAFEHVAHAQFLRYRFRSTGLPLDVKAELRAMTKSHGSVLSPWRSPRPCG